MRDRAWHQRLAGRPLHRRGAHQERGDHEDQPDAGVGAERVPGEYGGQRAWASRARPEPAPVDVVGEGAAVQPEDDERHQLDEADGADREVRAGQRVDLERDRDVADHRAEVEDGAGDEQQPEVAGGPPRSEVHAQPAQAIRPAHRPVTTRNDDTRSGRRHERFRRRASGGDDDGRADRGEVPQRDGVAVRWRTQPCDSGVPSWAVVCTGAPSSTGMAWKPIAPPASPWVKRTKYSIVPEPSIPAA